MKGLSLPNLVNWSLSLRSPRISSERPELNTADGLALAYKNRNLKQTIVHNFKLYLQALTIPQFVIFFTFSRSEFLDAIRVILLLGNARMTEIAFLISFKLPSV